ncbi:MAG: TonB-dependent receptor plug domain-containing protein [bacterium]
MMRWKWMILKAVSAASLLAVDAVAQEAAEGAEDDENYRIETVLITQDKIAKIGGAAHRIDEEELDRQDYSNPEAVVQQVPGVFTRGEDGFGLRPNIGVRGANSERSKKLALMEDGVLFGPAPYSAPAAYYFPMMSRMVGVEIFKGPGAVKYGPNTIAGALNLVTRAIPHRFAGGFDVSAGSYFGGRAHAHAGTSSDWGGFLIEGIHQQSDGFKELDGGGNSGFNRQEFMAKWALNNDYASEVFQRLEVKLGWSRETSHETYLGLSDADFEENPFRRYGASALDEMNWVRAQVELRHTVDWGEHLNLETVAYRHDLARSWFKVNGVRRRHRNL